MSNSDFQFFFVFCILLKHLIAFALDVECLFEELMFYALKVVNLMLYCCFM